MTETEAKDRDTIEEVSSQSEPADFDGLDGPDVAALIAERDDYLDQLRRALADFANFRRRTEQERAIIRQLANRDLLLQVVDVKDDFGRALGAIPEDQQESGWVSGIDLIEKKLGGVLEKAGVSPIDALGQPFDPSLHEAVATDPGSTGEVVVEVFRGGYKLGDQVLRAAMVKTGDKPVA